jgi:hypothetical protein
MEDIGSCLKEWEMLSSEYTDTRLLRAREEQLQRDVERIRVARERAAESLAARDGGTTHAGKNKLARAYAALFARTHREAQPACQ